MASFQAKASPELCICRPFPMCPPKVLPEEVIQKGSLREPGFIDTFDVAVFGKTGLVDDLAEFQVRDPDRVVLSVLIPKKLLEIHARSAFLNQFQCDEWGRRGFLLLVFHGKLVTDLVHLVYIIPGRDVDGFHLRYVKDVFTQQQTRCVHSIAGREVNPFRKILVTLGCGHQFAGCRLSQLLGEEGVGRAVTISERSRGYTVVQTLPVYIIQGCQRMIIAVDFQDEASFFGQTPLSFVSRIEVPAVGVAGLGDDLGGAIGLQQTVEMGGWKTIRQ